MQRILCAIFLCIGSLCFVIPSLEAQTKKPPIKTNQDDSNSSSNDQPSVIKKDDIIKKLNVSEQSGNQKFSGLKKAIGEMYPTLIFQIHFASNQAEILPESFDQLKEVGEALLSVELKDYLFEIGGHTDSAGEADYNLQLSQKRSEAIKKYLLENFPKITDHRLNAVGYGETKLIENPDDTAEKKAKNRRVEFKRLKKVDSK